MIFKQSTGGPCSRVLLASLLGIAGLLISGPGLALGQLLQAPTLFTWKGGPAPDEPDDSLNSDRPSFTPNSTTLGKGVFQIETGYLYTRESPQGQPSVFSHQLPETQLRWGMFADWFEFRMSQAFLSQEESAGGLNGALNGASDTSLGISLALTHQQGIFPECAWIPSITLPTGSSWASDGQITAGGALSYSWGFHEVWTLGASTQMLSQIDDESNSSYLATFQSCYLKRQFGEKTSAFGEWYASFPHGAESAIPLHFLDSGVLILLGENLQWDARVGTGICESQPDFFAGTGFSIRFR